jgi:RNA polymerase sigma factor (sigma-70 family)
MADEPKPQQGDEADLFAQYNDTLMRRVARVVRTSPETIEDACSIAWAQLLRHQPDRDREWRAWLFKTAQREAWALDQARYGTRSFDAEPDESGSAAEPLDPRDQFGERDDLEAAVDVLERLPPRLRRVAFLRATGHRYSEIQEITGDSRTRVSQLIRRATSRFVRRSRSSTSTQRRPRHEQNDCTNSSPHPPNGSARRSDAPLAAEAAGAQTRRAYWTGGAQR